MILTSPLLDDFDCCTSFLRPNNPFLYPQTQLLSIRQHKQVANGRDCGLSIEKGLGSLESDAFVLI